MGMTIKRAIKILKYIVYNYWLYESDEHGYSNLPTAEDKKEACKVALDFIEGYEQRLKADMVAMLTEIQLEIEEKSIIDYDEDLYDGGECIISISEIKEIIQQKINKLRGEKDETDKRNK